METGSSVRDGASGVPVPTLGVGFISECLPAPSGTFSNFIFHFFHCLKQFFFRLKYMLRCRRGRTFLGFPDECDRLFVVRRGWHFTWKRVNDVIFSTFFLNGTNLPVGDYACFLRRFLSSEVRTAGNWKRLGNSLRRQGFGEKRNQEKISPCEEMCECRMNLTTLTHFRIPNSLSLQTLSVCIECCEGFSSHFRRTDLYAVKTGFAFFLLNNSIKSILKRGRVSKRRYRCWIFHMTSLHCIKMADLCVAFKLGGLKIPVPRF